MEKDPAAKAAWCLLSGTILVGFIPGAGFIVWVFGGVILLVTFILSIVLLAKGNTKDGICVLLATLITGPLAILFAPLVSLAIIGVFTTKINAVDQPRPTLPVEATPVPLSPLAKATAKYPDLTRAGSAHNRAFVELVNWNRFHHPEVFDDPEWPSTLAEKSLKNIR